MSASELRRALRLFFALGAFALGEPSVARAGDVQGRVADGGGAGQVGMIVSVYAQGAKGWTFVTQTTAGANGYYGFGNALSSGAYRLRVTPNPGSTQIACWWASSGCALAEGDSTPITLAAGSSVVTGVNFSTGTEAVLTGRVLSGGTPRSGLYVRVLQRSDPRVFVEATTDPTGMFVTRGLAAGNYAIVIRDWSASWATTLLQGPYTATTGSSIDVGDLVVNPMPADAHEPNDGPAATGVSIDGTALHTGSSYVASAVITPGDVDWYCFAAVAGDHFAISTSSPLNVAGTPYDDFWLDPVVGFTADGGASWIAVGDDAGASRHPSLDVWIAQTGNHCVAVLTYSDFSFTGSGQASAGAYTLRIDPLNRYPTIAASIDGAPLPAAISSVEGEAVGIDLAFGDPDPGSLAVSVTISPGGAPDSVLIVGSSPGRFTWSLPAGAAAEGPFSVVFTVSDGELEATAQTVLTVDPGPAPPAPRFLEDCGSWVLGASDPSEAEVSFVYASTPVSFDLELVDASGTIATEHEEQTSGSTAIAFVSTAIAEDAPATVRVRTVGDYGASPWVDCDFFVDRVNAIPGETTLSVSDEPDGDTTVVLAVAGGDPEVEAGIPGAFVLLAYCVGDACGTDPSTWTRSSHDGPWRLVLGDLPRGRAETVYACTMDQAGACGPIASLDVRRRSAGGGCALGGRSDGLGVGIAVISLSLLARRARSRRGR